MLSKYSKTLYIAQNICSRKKNVMFLVNKKKIVLYIFPRGGSRGAEQRYNGWVFAWREALGTWPWMSSRRHIYKGFIAFSWLSLSDAPALRVHISSLRESAARYRCFTTDRAGYRVSPIGKPNRPSNFYSTKRHESSRHFATTCARSPILLGTSIVRPSIDSDDFSIRDSCRSRDFRGYTWRNVERVLAFKFTLTIQFFFIFFVLSCVAPVYIFRKFEKQKIPIWTFTGFVWNFCPYEPVYLF